MVGEWVRVLFKIFSRWSEFYTLKSVKASTFCLLKAYIKQRIKAMGKVSV